MTSVHDIAPQPAAKLRVATRHSIFFCRAYGIFVSPRVTFASIMDRPRWADTLALVTLVTMMCSWMLLRTEIGHQAYVDQQVATSESFGIAMTDETYARLQESANTNPSLQALRLGLSVPTGSVALAALLIAFCNAKFRCAVSFRHVLAIVAHANIILGLRQIVMAPLCYARESMSPSANLAVLLPFFPSGTIPSRLLGAVDVFVVWWLVVLAVGLGVLYQRSARGIALALLGTYGAAAAALTAIVTMLSAE